MLSDTYFNGNYSDGDHYSIQFYVDGVNRMFELMNNIRTRTFHVIVIRNALLTLVVVGVCIFVLTLTLQLFTFADIRCHGKRYANRV